MKAETQRKIEIGSDWGRKLGMLTWVGNLDKILNERLGLSARTKRDQVFDFMRLPKQIREAWGMIVPSCSDALAIMLCNEVKLEAGLSLSYNQSGLEFGQKGSCWTIRVTRVAGFDFNEPNFMTITTIGFYDGQKCLGKIIRKVVDPRTSKPFGNRVESFLLSQNYRQKEIGKSGKIDYILLSARTWYQVIARLPIGELKRPDGLVETLFVERAASDAEIKAFLG